MLKIAACRAENNGLAGSDWIRSWFQYSTGSPSTPAACAPCDVSEATAKAIALMSLDFTVVPLNSCPRFSGPCLMRRRDNAKTIWRLADRLEISGILRSMILAAMIFRFGPFAVDSGKFELTRDGQAVATEPQVLSVILHLIAQRDHVVSRDELVDAIWHGRAISDAAISSRIKSARHALGDNGSAQAVIRTIHGRGFRFVAQVSEDSASLQGEVHASTAGPVREPLLGPDSKQFDRRALLAGSVAGAAALAGGSRALAPRRDSDKGPSGSRYTGVPCPRGDGPEHPCGPVPGDRQFAPGRRAAAPLCRWLGDAGHGLWHTLALHGTEAGTRLAAARRRRGATCSRDGSRQRLRRARARNPDPLRWRLFGAPRAYGARGRGATWQCRCAHLSGRHHAVRWLPRGISRRTSGSPSGR